MACKISIFFVSSEQHLKGAVRTDRAWPYSYHIEERNHRFLQVGSKYFRENEIWRLVIDKKTGQRLREERLIRNFSEVKYTLHPLPAQPGKDASALERRER